MADSMTRKGFLGAIASAVVAAKTIAVGGPWVSDAEATRLISASPARLWIKDRQGRVLWGRSLPDSPDIIEAEARALQTREPEIIWSAAPERDYHVIIFSATWRGGRVIVGQAIPL